MTRPTDGTAEEQTNPWLTTRTTHNQYAAADHHYNMASTLLLQHRSLYHQR